MLDILLRSIIFLGIGYLLMRTSFMKELLPFFTTVLLIWGLIYVFYGIVLIAVVLAAALGGA